MKKTFEILNRDFMFVEHPQRNESDFPVNQYLRPVTALPESDGDDNYIWTVVQGDKGFYIVAGYQFVNRIGYLLSEVPWTDYMEIRLSTAEFSEHHA